MGELEAKAMGINSIRFAVLPHPMAGLTVEEIHDRGRQLAGLVAAELDLVPIDQELEEARPARID